MNTSALPRHIVTNGFHRAWLHVDETASQPLIAILDTGFRPEIAYRHNNLSPIPEWLIVGRNWVEPGCFPLDLDGHGTGILSIISSIRPDVHGVNPFCRVMPQKVDGHGVRDRQENWAKAIVDAVEVFAKLDARGIILLASGAWGFSKALEEAIDITVKEDVLLISIAHNDNICGARFPGRLALTHDNVICVGAINDSGERLLCPETGRGSNYGPEVTIYSPGENIPALTLTGKMHLVSGTSASAALVAGLAALALAIEPDMKPSEIKKQIVAGGAGGGELINGQRLIAMNSERTCQNIINRRTRAII